MSNDLMVGIGAEFVGKKAFKEADKGVKGLSKGVKDLAKIFGTALSAKAVADFAKASIKAFTDDQKEATRLAKVIDNLGLSFANPEITRFIDELTRASGVADSQLRPAFQALITTTGSLTNSQALLKQAIDISVGSGVDLTTVAQDLANAYVGNTKGLKKYNLGLTQAELKTAKFADIQERLTKLFSGSNAAILGTYAGQMQLLSNAANEAKETIGKGIVDGLTAIAGDGTEGIKNLTAAMDDLALSLADVFRGIGEVVSGFNKIPHIKTNTENLKALLGGAWYLLSDIGKNKRINQMGAGIAGIGGSQSMQEFTSKQQQKQQAAAEKAAQARAKELAKATNKNTKALKDQAALKKTAAVFDQKQIEIVAALKGKISEEEKVRLNLLLAIEQGNVEEAQKWQAKLSEIQARTVDLKASMISLGTDIPNPFKTWGDYLKAFQQQLANTTFTTPSMTAATISTAASTAAAGLTGMEAISAGAVPVINNNVQLTVNGSVTTESDLVDFINSGLNSRSLSGSPSAIGRFLGTFAP